MQANRIYKCYLWIILNTGLLELFWYRNYSKHNIRIHAKKRDRIRFHATGILSLFPFSFYRVSSFWIFRLTKLKMVLLSLSLLTVAINNWVTLISNNNHEGKCDVYVKSNRMCWKKWLTHVWVFLNVILYGREKILTKGTKNNLKDKWRHHLVIDCLLVDTTSFKSWEQNRNLKQTTDFFFLSSSWIGRVIGYQKNDKTKDWE
jgi:diacylglycerol kinase